MSIYSKTSPDLFSRSLISSHLNDSSFRDNYDEIEICQNSAEAHYKSAIQIRNRQMIDRSDLIVCCIEHNSGGAYQTIQYARNQKKEIINLADLSTR